MKLDLTKILAYFNNLNDQARYAVLGGIVVLVILLDVFFLVMPQLGGIADINDKITKLSADTKQVLVDKERINQLRQNLDDGRLQLRALSVKMRSIQEVPAILSTISSIANEYAVKIDQLVPEKDDQETLSADAQDKYYALPIVLKAHSGYHAFGRFLSKLENENLYFIVKDFIIQNDDKDAQTRSFSLTIKIILVDRAAAPAKSL